MATDARIALRSNIESTRQSFHRLLNTIPEQALTQPGKNPALTNGELLMQICIAPRIMMSNLKNVVDQSWIYPPLLKSSPKPLKKKLNELYVRHRAHRTTSLSLSIEFDKTCLFALKLLEEMWEEDFETRLFISEEDVAWPGKISRKEAFDYLMYYFETHSKQLDFTEKKTDRSRTSRRHRSAESRAISKRLAMCSARISPALLSTNCFEGKNNAGHFRPNDTDLVQAVGTQTRFTS
jgi:hypothetical protein